MAHPYPCPPETMQNILSCIPHLYTWTYDPDGTLIATTCPNRAIFHELFFQCDYMQQILDYAKNASSPYALSIYMGLVWYAVLEKEENILKKIYLLGPVFQYPVSPRRLDNVLREYEDRGMSFRSRRLLLQAMKDLPVIPHTQLASYGIMLHYCANGQRLTYRDLNALKDTPEDAESSPEKRRNRRPRPSESDPSEPLESFYAGTAEEFDQKQTPMPDAVYQTIRRTEENLVERLRSGTLLDTEAPDDPQTYHMALLPTDSSGIVSPLGKSRFSAVLLTYLCARTAVDCGLTWEEAYRLADEYIGKIDEHHSPIGLQHLMSSICQDFGDRIRRFRRDSHPCSREVRLCEDYVHNHLTENIPMKHLADLTGYTPYYLSRKFKEETGCPLTAYIRREKIKYAAHLLITTEDSISKITEEIGLSSRSHFSEDFAKIMGMPPGAYRKKFQK